MRKLGLLTLSSVLLQGREEGAHYTWRAKSKKPAHCGLFTACLHLLITRSEVSASWFEGSREAMKLFFCGPPLFTLCTAATTVRRASYE